MHPHLSSLLTLVQQHRWRPIPQVKLLVVSHQHPKRFLDHPGFDLIDAQRRLLLQLTFAHQTLHAFIRLPLRR